jgi:hypothetical protein
MSTAPAAKAGFEKMEVEPTHLSKGRMSGLLSGTDLDADIIAQVEGKFASALFALKNPLDRNRKSRLSRRTSNLLRSNYRANAADRYLCR